jgi:hypothetical protein
LDFYALRQIDSDRPTRQFFARLQHRLSPADRVYSYDLNEDILGRARLEMLRQLISVRDPRRLAEELSRPGAYLLAETAWVQRRAELAASLDAVETGRAGRRAMALYRSRVEYLPRISSNFLSQPPALALVLGHWSTHEAETMRHSAVEKKAPNGNHEKNRRDDGSDLCFGSLAYPERVFGDELFPEEQLLDDEIKDEGDGNS